MVDFPPQGTNTRTESIIIYEGDDTTDLTTGNAKRSIRMPYAMTLTEVRASLVGAATGAVKASGTIVCASVVANTFSTATVTCASVLAADTVTINGLLYTAVSGARANDTEFSIDTSDTACGIDLEAAIDGDSRTGTSGDVSGDDNGSGVVTCTTTITGTGGNAITIVSSNGTRLAVTGSGNFTGGVTADTAVVNGLTYTAVGATKADDTEFDISGTNDQAATDLADSIDDDVRTGTLADLTSTATTDTVTSVSTLFGTRGNAVTLASSDEAGRLTISASTFASGANEFTADVHDSGTTIFSGVDKLVIDESELTTTTAVFPPIITDINLADDALITIDIDTVGGSAAGKGLKVTLIGHRA